METQMKNNSLRKYFINDKANNNNDNATYFICHNTATNNHNNNNMIGHAVNCLIISSGKDARTKF